MTPAITPAATLPPKPASKPFGPFRVNIGKHIEDDPSGEVLRDGRIKEKVYTPADGPFYSSTNLMKLNAPGMTPKFTHVLHEPQGTVSPLTKQPGENSDQYADRMRKLAEEATRLATSPSEKALEEKPPSAIYPTLETMNAKELQQWAAEEEVDLKNAKSKEDILKVIKSYLGA